MNCSSQDAGEIPTLPAKHAAETVPIDFDWHDLLANLPARGKAYGLTARVRLRRRHPRAAGLEFECTTSGSTGSDEPRWPKVEGETVTDGTVEWTAREISSSSLRTSISSTVAPSATGLTVSGPSVEDLAYRYLVAGGYDGQAYLLTHRVTCANGEILELVGRLPIEG